MKLGGRLGLTLKPLDRLGRCGDMRGKHLKSDGTREGTLPRLVDRPHAAATDDLAQLKIAKDGFGRR